jgi:hypothetical protein
MLRHSANAAPLAATFMKKFRIKETSLVLQLLTIVPIISGATMLEGHLLPRDANEVLRIAYFAVVLIGAIFAARFTSKANTQWLISESEIHIKGHRQYFFQRKPELKISWSEIQAYKYQPDQNAELFELTGVNGRKIKLWHDSLERDDFESFINYFEKRVEEYNQKEIRFHKDITRTKTIYEGGTGIAIATMFILSLGIIIALNFMSKSAHTNWARMLLLIVATSYIIFQVIAYRKKSSS